MRLILLLCSLLLSGAAIAGEITGTTVTYRSGEEDVSGYLATPAGPGPFPAVVLIHEWWGLNGWVRANADEFARRGYAALAIDLYRGKVATSSEEAHELMRGLPEGRAGRDLKSAVAYLRALPAVGKQKIGTIGWCMGGGYSLMAAMTVKGLAGSVICYGRLVSEQAEIKSIGAPLLGIFGGADRGIPVESVTDFEKAARKAGKEVEITIYPEAGHAFMNRNNEGSYREEDTADAWKRIFGFFAVRLGGSREPR